MSMTSFMIKWIRVFENMQKIVGDLCLFVNDGKFCTLLRDNVLSYQKITFFLSII